LLARRMLLGAGFTDADLANAKFFGDHAAVCKAVLDGAADAGATFANDGRGGPLAGCAETEGAERAALLALNGERMQAVFHADAFVPADDGDFAPLRDLCR
jgi:hypothetical protein